jgi:triacylglycerol esterase/lipase EstA (alpha/beta hydrolase family)
MSNSKIVTKSVAFVAILLFFSTMILPNTVHAVDPSGPETYHCSVFAPFTVDYFVVEKMESGSLSGIAIGTGEITFDGDKVSGYASGTFLGYDQWSGWGTGTISGNSINGYYGGSASLDLGGGSILSIGVPKTAGVADFSTSQSNDNTIAGRISFVGTASGTQSVEGYTIMYSATVNVQVTYYPAVPVILVYGYRDNAESWNVMSNLLTNDGYPVNIFEYDTTQTAKDSATPLAEFIMGVCDPNSDGIPEILEVDVIAHSFGGLVSRYCIEKLGMGIVVRNLIMLGTPNHGSPLADYVTGALDDQPDSARMNGVVRTLVSIGDIFAQLSSMGSTWDLRTESFNSFLSQLNSDYNQNADSIKTKYFAVAGTGHFSNWPLYYTSTILVGHDDGAVQVDSVRLGDTPLYCVSLNHFSLMNNAAVYNSIIQGILDGSPLDTSFFPVPSEPDSADNVPLPFSLTYEEGRRIYVGEKIEGMFGIMGKLIFDLFSVHCDYRVTLVSPSGLEITPENYNEVIGASYNFGEHNWHYEIERPEAGQWQYRIEALEVPEGGTDITILTMDIPNPPEMQVPESPLGTIMALAIPLIASMGYFTVKKRRKICSSSS